MYVSCRPHLEPHDTQFHLLQFFHCARGASRRRIPGAGIDRCQGAGRQGCQSGRPNGRPTRGRISAPPHFDHRKVPVPYSPPSNVQRIANSRKRETAKTERAEKAPRTPRLGLDRLVRFAFVTDYHRFAQTLDPPHTSLYRTSVVINTVSNTHISPLRWCGAPSFDESLGSRRQSLSDTPARAARSRPASLPPSCRGRRPRRCTSRGRPPQSRAGCRSGFGGSRSPRGSPQ